MSTELGFIIFGGKKIPSADNSVFVRCGDPNCQQVHIIACDDANEPFAELSMTEEMLMKALELIRGPAQ